MDIGIKGKRALVWGGSRGVGRAVAKALASEGADVAVCARKQWAAEHVAREVAEISGVKSFGYGIDGTDEHSAVAPVLRAMEAFGGLDIFFGISRRPELGEDRELTSEDWMLQFESGFLRLNRRRRLCCLA